MFEYLQGQIVNINPTYIVIDVNDVGYKLLFANPYKLKLNQKTKIFVEQIIRDNDQSLYGFSTIDEKILFQKLIGVSGIGPKSALAILTASDAQGLAKAVEANDVDYLQSFPGIGKKTAQQIILDLKGKLDSNVQITSANPNLNNALAALTALGYSKKDVDLVKEKISDDSLSTDEIISLGLKLLSR